MLIATGWGRFFIPVITLFYIASQVTLAQFSFIFSAFMIATLLLEVPSGIFADRFGKKNAIILSRICYVVEISLLAFTNGFWFFLVAKIISGFGVSFQSGAMEAITYDTTKKLNRVKEHKQITASIQVTSFVSMAVVFLIGAYLFSLHPKLPAIASIPLAVGGLLFSLLLYEPTRAATKKEASGLKITSSQVTRIILISIPIALSIEILTNFSSLFITVIGFPVWTIGIISTVYLLLSILITRLTPSLEEKIGSKRSLIIILLCSIFSIGVAAIFSTQIAIISFIILAVANGAYSVLTNHYMNEHIKSSNRATILSIRSFYISLVIAATYILIGLFNLEIQTIFQVVFVVLVGYCVFFLSRREDKK
ncbi:MAG: MFS family permease [Candidatus Woesearchaeota archaeon]|jgi:MFS family permease